MSWRLLAYLRALTVGLVAGTITNSPTVAGLAALVFASTWVAIDRYVDRKPS